MPAGSIMNGCTGTIKPVEHEEFETWRAIIRVGADLGINPLEAAQQTCARHLHCVELWMPGKCNLSCRHCYVASRPKPKALTSSEYYDLTLKFINDGFIDVVIPGMEPLLRRELWSVLSAASDGHARSVGMTTNATLLAKNAKRLSESSLTVLNVSLDGSREIHDRIRGEGSFKSLQEGVERFRAVSQTRMLTNTTVNSENIDELASIASWSLQSGIDYSAFHPFESADEALNSLAIDSHRAVLGYERLFESFMRGETSSIVLEAEASTFSVIVLLAQRGLLNNASLVIDEAGFLFLKEQFNDRQLLVGLNFYPHHYIRTVRITDDGGISSCRSMAKTGWHGVGDVRRDPVRSILRQPSAIQELAAIWSEFRSAPNRLGLDALGWFIDFLASKLDKEHDAVSCQFPSPVKRTSWSSHEVVQ